MVANKKQQIKNSFIYLLPVITNTVLPIITLPIFTRILTKEDYGVLALVQIYAIFLNGLANFGLTSTYNRNYFQYHDDSKKTAQLLFSTLLFVILNFFAFALLSYHFKGALAKLIVGDAQHGNILFFAFCAQFLSSISSYYYAYFKNSEMAKDYVVYTIAGSLINVFLSLFMVSYLRTGVIGLIYSSLFTGTIIFGVMSYKFVTRLKFSFNKSILFESLKLSYPLTPIIFFGIINTQFDKYMIGLMATLGGVGIYSLAQKVATVTFLFMTSLQNVFSPQVYKKMFDLKEVGGLTIGKYLTPFLYVSTACALLVALFSEEIIYVLMPVSYHGATDIVIIFSMYYGILFFGKITPMQLMFKKKTHICTIFSIVSIGLNIALNIPFIMKWGALGAAWATFLAGLISGSIYFAVSQYYYEIKWEYKKVGLIYLILFASSISMVLLRNPDVEYTIRLMVKCTSITLYIYLGVLIRVITVENYNIVKNILPFRGNMLFQRKKNRTL